MTNEEKTQHIQTLERELAAQRLVNDALAERLRVVTEERDRYFNMKRHNAGRFGELRATLQDLRHEAKQILAGSPLLLGTAAVLFVTKVADG